MNDAVLKDIINMKEGLPDFSGKMVVFYTANAPGSIQDGILLEFISFQDFGGRLFVNGRIPLTDSKGIEWESNLKAAIAWEDVTHFVVFDSRDDYIDRMSKSKVSFFQRLLG